MHLLWRCCPKVRGISRSATASYFCTKPISHNVGYWRVLLWQRTFLSRIQGKTYSCPITPPPPLSDSSHMSTFPKKKTPPFLACDCHHRLLFLPCGPHFPYSYCGREMQARRSLDHRHTMPWGRPTLIFQLSARSLEGKLSPIICVMERSQDPATLLLFPQT